MENKKTIIAIIIVVVLIIALVAVSYLFYNFSETQLNILTEESNKLLQQDLLNEEINQEIKTEKDYAVVEKTVKEYLLKLKNIYLQTEELNKNLKIEELFVGENATDGKFDKIDKIEEEYRTQSKEYLEQYKELISEEKIVKEIENANISSRKDYYIELYKTIMLSDTMKNQYSKIEEQIEKSKDSLYDKLNVVTSTKKFLENNSKYWKINDENQLIFTNTNIMVQYYDMINKANS